jgi:hypothetical protein
MTVDVLIGLVFVLGCCVCGLALIVKEFSEAYKEKYSSNKECKCGGNCQSCRRE